MSRLVPLLVVLVWGAVLAGGCSSGTTGAVVELGVPSGEGEEPIPPLTATSVVAFRLGPQGAMSSDDLRAMKSSGEAYTEKWEVNLYGRPYEVKIRFEVANLGFGDFKGRVKGQVKQFDGTQEVATWPIDGTFTESQWRSSKSGPFELTFGKWRLAGEPGAYTLSGVAGNNDEVSFSFDVVGQPWRPGTGMVVFGQDASLYLKTQTLVAQGQTTGTVEIGGQKHRSEGRVYGTHFATNVAAHELADRIYHFRKQDDELFVEWRSYVTSRAWENQPFGYIVVSYLGEVVFESTSLELLPHDYWTDPDHYNYTIENGLTVRAFDGDDQLLLRFDASGIDAKDPLQSLPALERSVAAKFAQPIEYTVRGSWRLDLLVDGQAATLEDEGSYSTTSFR